MALRGRVPGKETPANRVGNGTKVLCEFFQFNLPDSQLKGKQFAECRS